MKNQTLSIEQMKHLKDLGVDVSKASMCWWLPMERLRSEEGYLLDAYEPHVKEQMSDDPIIRAFTLQDICELFENVKYKSVGFPIMFFDYNYSFRHWELALRNPSGFENPIIKEKTPIDAAYKMLCWLAENGHLKGGKP